MARACWLFMVMLSKTHCFASMRLCLLTCLSLAVLVAGCSKIKLPRLEFGDEKPKPSIPLRVRVEIDPLLQQAALKYQDFCGQPQAISVGETLQEQLLADTRKVFQEVIDRDSSSGRVPDGVLHFSIEEQSYELFILHRGAGETYPATATLGVRAVFREGHNGPEVFSSSARGIGKWKVVSDESGVDCELEGIGIPVNDALEEISEQLVDTLKDSSQLRAVVVRLLAKRQGAAHAAASPTVRQPVPLVGDGRSVPGGLSFRALLEDGNRNRVLEGGERISMTVEVTNSGPGIVHGLMVALSGTPALVGQFNAPIAVGAIQAGERKQVTLTATLPSGLAEQQSELIVAVRGPDGLIPPPPKRFIAWVRPSRLVTDGLEVLSVDVDHIPANAGGFERKNRFAVVVGLGTYRGEKSPSLAYAKRDAEVVAEYLKAVAGVPETNIRVLTDEFAVLSDLREAFERWLPQHVGRDSVVMVYVVGKGVARTKTGEIFLLPFEARSASRYRVYPLSFLLKSVSRLSAKTILFFDLSFPNAGKHPTRLAWLGPNASRNDVALIASSNVAAPSVQFDVGQHGLFTYYWLKGLGGAADENQNGTVVLTELYGYLKDHLPKAVQAEQQQARFPILVPNSQEGMDFGVFPLGKVTQAGSSAVHSSTR